MKLTILVLLFNRDTILNDTTKSLLKQGELLGTVDLIIFNNGPGQFLDLNNEFIDSLRSIYSLVEIKQDINNNPLSVIYNEFVKKYPSDYYLILDDDIVNALSSKIESMPLDDEMSSKAIERRLSESTEINELLKSIPVQSVVNINQQHSGSGDNVGGNKIVNR